MALAGVYQSEGKLKQASKTLDRARISPSYWEISFPIVVRQAFLNRRYHEAIQLLHRAIETHNLPKEAIGRYYQQLGFAE